ncbi:S-layer homology domain-containing protein [Calothrix sp. UHCC 0171]|uniref:S-layer homology domain-containing protein n=1 Tax=Calothrix sp. UHCC 0171 TaxID=3110245 RepID=UPI002B1EA1D0|nr:S-layer homology domain-containing protein [Calothrix sp. UHCC 0171]MEA5571295.1 S-layer homology domain-containing protein [Calothrix sp. UHCC 0171]
MLYRKRPFVFLCLAVILTTLTACANNPSAKDWEQSLAADPRLKDNPLGLGTNQVNPTPEAKATIQLPADFPKDIVYANAQLQEISPGTENQVLTRWDSADPSNIIASFYRTQFQAGNWQITQQPTDDTEGRFVATKDKLLVQVSIQPKSVTNVAPNQPQTSTELRIDYSPNGTAFAPTPQITETPLATNTNTASNLPQPGNPEFIGPVPQETPIAVTSPPANISVATTTNPQQYSDINKASQQLQQYIQDLAALGVLPVTAKNSPSNNSSAKNNAIAPNNLFEPGKIITRREYAGWLVAANNAMYANNPAKQIRLAAETTQPAFSDVPKNNPDFPVIQGLAEAGLIPSPLSGDATEVIFRPDAPLTREQLILWKLPLDTRQALPTANLEAVKQTWGFQDAGKIDPKALRAVLADFQNGEQSNIRRVFGYTTLFQPKKPVNRAEAAAALWYFGTQGDGVSATDALKLKGK